MATSKKDPLEPITAYIEHVRARPSVHAEKTRQAVERVAKLVERVRAGCEIVYDDTEVRAVFRFFSKLVADESGQKIKLLDWQRFFIAALYGFRYKDSGRIYYNDAFLFIAKKNGKTALSAGLALYNLITHPAAQVILVATDYNQAKIAFEDICKYARNTPTLAAGIESGELFIRESPPLNVVFYPLGSKILIIPETRAKSAQGFNATFALFDEIASYRTSEIIQKITSGQVRDNSIRLSLTTAETNMQNPGYNEYERARHVLDGRFEATNYLPLIYELDNGDDKWTEATYCKANPGLDIIKPLRKLVEERDRARQNPIEEASFFAYQLNLWSQNRGADISDEDWHPAIDNAASFAGYITPDKLATYPCFGAIDLSKIDDYTAYTLYFWIKPIAMFAAIHRFYIPQAMLDKKIRLETEQVSLWVRDGHIQATRDGNGDRVINLDYLLADITADFDKYKMLGLTYDAAHAVRFIGELEEKVPRLATLPFQQGWKQIGPANKRFLEMIYKKRLIDANPVMRWMVGCVRINIDRLGNTYFEKIDYRQSPLRIDGVDTSVMALARLSEYIDQGEPDNEAMIKNLEAIEY